MAYYDKAAGRPDVNDPLSNLKPRNTAKSNQERFTGTGVRRVTPNPAKFNSGNLVRFAGNPYGSSTLKDALNTYQRRMLGASENPAGTVNQPNTKKAAPRNPGAKL